MLSLIDGSYEVVDVLGEGGMSTVYLVRQVRLGSLWAIKQIHKDTRIRMNFRKEADILRQLQHPMFPYFVGVHEDEDDFYIIEEYVRGVNLQKWLEDNRKTDEETGKQWFLSLCDALNYLHKQTPPIIYSDMKPSNIMLQPDGKLKLLDLGISRQKQEMPEESSGKFGTYGYAAPEQFGEGVIDVRTDIYALGVTMYHLLTGKSPFEPPYTLEPARKINPDLSAGMEHILERCVQSDPVKRYSSVDELLADMANIHVYDEAYQAQELKKKKRRRMLTALGIAGVCGIVAGLSFYQIRTDNQRKSRMDQVIAQKESAQARSPVEEGILLLSQGSFEEAKVQFDQAIEEDTQNAEAYKGRGDALQGLALGEDDNLDTLEQREGYYQAAAADYEKYRELTGEAAAEEDAALEELKNIEDEKKLKSLCQETAQAIDNDNKDSLYKLFEEIQPYIKQYRVVHRKDNAICQVGDKTVIAGAANNYYIYYGEIKKRMPEGHGIFVSTESRYRIWLEADWKEGKASGTGTEKISHIQPELSEEGFVSRIRKGALDKGLFEGEITDTLVYCYDDPKRGNRRNLLTDPFEIKYTVAEGFPAIISKSELPKGDQWIGAERLQDEDVYAWSEEAGVWLFITDYWTCLYDIGEW